MVDKKRNFKRRPFWDEYFMEVAILVSYRASCLYVQAGAVIVKDKRIIATGYNGAPQGIDSCLVRGCNKDREGISQDTKNTGICIGEHAERNALLQVGRDKTLGATMYSRLFPCSDCAKQIIGAGIERVFYFEMYEEPNNLANILFNEAGVDLIHLQTDNLIKYKFFLDTIYATPKDWNK